MSDFYSSPKVKMVIYLFKTYNKMLTNYLEGDEELSDIEGLTFSSRNDDIGERIQTSNISNPTEQIALKRSNLPNTFLIISSLNYSIYLSASKARLKDRKRIREILHDSLINQVPAIHLDIKEHTLAKYRRYAIENALFLLSNYGLI